MGDDKSGMGSRASFAGHAFADAALLDEALTTPSCRMDGRRVRDNQRLEFLGDAVLGLLAAERLYSEFPDEEEGPLTVRRTRMVSTSALCRAAGRTDLSDRLRRNRGAAALPEGSKTFADAVEALIGAAYLDGGLESARGLFDRLSLGETAEADAKWGGNPKGELQIRAQAMKPPRRPEYLLVSTAGKAHEPVFTVRVLVDGVGEAEATAHSHKEAESRAAAALLSRMDEAARGGLKHQ